MSNAMERLRHALYERTDSFGMVLEAARDLLAEHDDGVWIDTRRLIALGAQAALEREGPDDDLPWRVWVNGESTPWAPTAADALAAAEREAS